MNDEKINFKGAWLAIFMMCGMFLASNVPVVRLPEVGLHLTDKMLHFVAYGALATSIIRIPIVVQTRFRGILFAMSVAILFGVFDELVQHFSGRSCDFFDLIADSLGAVVASIFYTFFTFYRKLLEFDFFGIFKRK